jgi:glycerol-3-phosphate dehydrogenase
VLFVIPWRDHWIVGTTDTDWQLDRARPAASAADIGYLLSEVNRVLRRPLTTADVVGVYVGLRPLVSSAAAETAKLSREHVIEVPAPGLVTVTGGKYTTYRVMAADAVDAAVRDLDAAVPASCTADVPLVGAAGFRALWNQRESIGRDAGISVHRMESMLSRYGDRVPDLLAGLSGDPHGADPLPGADGHLRCEVAYAVTHEGARHLDDVLTRRTHISVESWDRGLAAAPIAGSAMARQLNWDPPTTEREIRTYQERVRSERESQAQPDDVSAHASRLSSAEILPPARV